MVFVIRVKTNAGNFRVGGLDPYNATSADVVAAFPTTASDAFRSCRVDGMHITTPLCTDPRCTVPLDANRPLAYQGLNHGGSVHCKVAFRHLHPPPGLGCNTRNYGIASPSARAVGGGSTAVATSGVGDARRRPKSLLDLEARPKIGLHQQTIRPRNALLTACPWLSRDEASEALRNADGDVERAKTASASTLRQKQQQQQQRLPHQIYSSSTAAMARNDERIDETAAMTTSYNYFANSYPRAVYQSNLSNVTNNYFASSNSSAGQQTMRPRNALLTA